MPCKSLLGGAALFVSASLALQAQTGTSVLPTDLFSTYSIYGQDAVSTVAVDDPAVPFTQALRIVHNSTPGASYSAALFWQTTIDVPKGDLLLVTFWLKSRGLVLNPLHVSPIFQSQDPALNYRKALSANAPSDRNTWVRYAIPFRTDDLYTSSGIGSALQFFFGDGIQSFEIGGISLVDFGAVANPIPASISSRFAFYYPGRGDRNAPWRIAAEKNISQSRMADLNVRVVSHGVPVPHATITLDQTRSAFGWGSAVVACVLDGTCASASDVAKYRAAVLRNFNIVGFENDLKWPEWECCRADTLDALAWLNRHRIPVRGHNLIWPNFSTMPSDTAALSPPELRARIDNHFADEEGTLKGRVFEWDVVNEPYTSNQVQGLIPGVPGVTPSNGVLGNHALIDWYTLAASIDPHTRRYLNDYNVFESKDPVHFAYDSALLQYLNGDGDAHLVQGFGFQSHFFQVAPVFSDMLATLKAFDPSIAQYGITEFDFTTIDPALQADLTRDYMTFVFGQPKFHEFVMWGFWDGRHFVNSAPLYYLDWSLKPSGRVWQELTGKTWQTHTTNRAGTDGRLSQRAFRGAYTITAAAHGKSCSRPYTLKWNASVTVSLDCP